MASHIFKIERGKFGLSLTDPGNVDPCAAVLADYTDFGCQITDGALKASPNVTTETVPATWCQPEQSLPQVGATSYSVDLGYLQDPDVVDGLSRFLFEHDAELAYFYVGMDGDDPPKAIGQLRLASGTIGGPGRTTLTATVSLPVEGKPSVCFGNAAGSAAVPAVGDVTATNLPNAATFANLAALQADPTSGDGAYSGPVFATGEYVVLGDASQAHYTASAWSAGPMT